MSTANLSRRTLRIRALAFVFGGAAVVAMLGLLVVNSSTGLAARSTNAKSLRLLVECTTAPELRDPPERNVPASDCYSRQQKAQASFTAPDGPFANLITAASACGAANPGDLAATRACVVKALKR
jgi:hypothetical protein